MHPCAGVRVMVVSPFLIPVASQRCSLDTKAAAVSGVRDERSCCCYNRAFIEHISILLEEPDASESLRDSLLEEGKSVV